ncbi:MAG: RNA polymerase sigma factor RpoH [Pseudomonadota bacterium]|nr:RNA polymerase sigma factor RpoH [Pseudomonadota bacterium]
MPTNTALMTMPRAMQLGMPGVSVNSYIHAVNGLPTLSKDDELELADRFRNDGDLTAARTLVMSHLRFVVHIAKSYMGYGLPEADLIQEGNIGLMKAVKRYDPSHNVRLISFAVHWIKSEIHDYVIRNWRIVKVATTKAQRKLFFNLRRMKEGMASLTQKEAQSIANDLNVKVSDVTEMEKRLYSHDASFDPTPQDDEEKAFAPAYYLEDSNTADPADFVADQDEAHTQETQLAHAMANLDERSRDILQSRWLTEDKATLHELADKYDVSAERIRQIEKSAMDKLRSSMQPLG